MDENSAEAVLRALRRTRQVRQFTDEPVPEAAIQAILEVARWTGSSENHQPWMFIVIRDRGVREAIGKSAPYAEHVGGAPVAIALAMNGENEEWNAYDEGRAAERMLIAAGALGLGGGIGWAEGRERDQVGELLGVTPPAFVRTVVALGHPTEEARRPRTGPGTGRRPLAELVRER
jgi:nitroreductase